ncbi:hypothetical protein DPSP01_002266 [Paraphaeosphaeria sporulosa]
MAPFMSLPGELRTLIYDMVLFPHHSCIQIHASHPKDLLRTTLKSPIFRLCRTVRHEAFARLCESKHLQFRDYMSYKTLLQYARNIGDGAIVENNVKHIMIFVDNLAMIEGNGNFSTFNVGPFDMVEANNVFAELHALQVVRLRSIIPAVQEVAQLGLTRFCPSSSAELARKLDETMTWRFEIVQPTLMNRDAGFGETCVDTVLTRRAISGVAPRSSS